MSASARTLLTALALSAAGMAARADTLGAPPALLAQQPSPNPAAGGRAADDLTYQSSYAVPTKTDRAGRIIAPVMINGKGPFRFMVDTGANRTVLAASTLAKLGLPADTRSLIPVSGVSGFEQAPSVHIDALDAGDLHFREVDLPILAGPVFQGLDGILGMDGFNNMKVFADFDRDQIRISESLGKHAPFSYSLMHAQFLSDRLLMVDGKVGRVAVKAIIDTGAAHTIGNPALLSALMHARPAHGETTGVTDVTQVWQSATLGRVPSLQMGDLTVQQLQIVFGDFKIFNTWSLQDQPALLVGMDVLGTIRALDIDYRRKEVAILPRAETHHFIQRVSAFGE